MTNTTSSFKALCRILESGNYLKVYGTLIHAGRLLRKVDKILISACLLGRKVRYDGNALPVPVDIPEQWTAQGRVISVCPEFDAGMGIPRTPAEICGGDGYDVWAGTASVFCNNGSDVTAFFKKGAEIALKLCRKYNITIAVLAENSPSCGSSTIYDGSFTGRKIPGTGVTAALLEKNGVKVFNQQALAVIS
jgi:uncharacterized protein YbbK (DUF523 family)